MIGVVAVVLVLLAGCALNKDNEGVAAVRCDYQRAAEPAAKDVGTPPANKPGSPARTATIDSSIGAIEIEFAQAAPCTVRSFAFLAGKKYFDGTSCHRLVTEGILVLQCGDPTGTGTGGPGYQFGTENLPAGTADPYPAGTLAMARTNDPNTNGSQFFIVYGSSQLRPDYTVFGKVTKGLDAIQNAAKAGHDGSLDASAGGGRPKTEVTLKSVTTS
jgi:peptidyl-prolyl cis-trans isomerase B (cyclophilin B)